MLAHDLNDVIIAMREPGHEAAEVDLLMSALQSKVLHDLVDQLGRWCRREAIATIMESGFPHAMSLAPEDVEYLRRTPEVGRPPRVIPPMTEADLQVLRSRRVGAAIISAGQVASIAGLVVVEEPTGSLPILFLIAALLTLLAMATKAIKHPALSVGWSGLYVTFAIEGVAAARLASWPPVLGCVSMLAGFVAGIAHHRWSTRGDTSAANGNPW